MDNPLLRLPYELRLQIYSSALGQTKSRPLYIQRHIWSLQPPHLNNIPRRKCHNLLLVCRQMYNDVILILYRRHELQLYTTTTCETSISHQRICRIEDYTKVLSCVEKLRLTLFAPPGNDPNQEKVLLALMGYLKAVLAKRDVSLKTLSIVMCAVRVNDSARSTTAILYAAQGFRELAQMTTFHFQCGFSGVGSESAREALIRDGKKRIVGAVVEEEALSKLVKAWSNTGPMGWWNSVMLGSP